MAKFQVLVGSALVSAIAGRAKAVSTFTEREHQLAYSALNHVELHNDPKHLNGLLNVTPANYRKGLVSWAVAYGKVTFDAKTRAFVYAKGKKSDMETAMDVAPANYEKAQAAAKATTSTFDEIKYIERVIAKLEESNASPRVISAMKGVLVVAKTDAVPVAAVAKAKTVKAKAPKVEAPVVEEQKIAA